MKTTRMSAIPRLRSGWRACRAILVLALGLMVCSNQVSQAAPMGTAFTYQGRLLDANSPADGPYDFEFKLHDADAAGIQQGSTVTIGDLDVIDGSFSVELDFGRTVFDGEARWLEIGVRPVDFSDPCEYTVLSPRTELTPLPYALHTRGIFVDPNGNVGIGTTSPTAPLHISRYLNGTHLIAKVENTGPFSAAAVEVKTAASGNDWLLVAQDTGTGGAEGFRIDQLGASGGVRMAINAATGNVGIGTTTPSAKLDVAGEARATVFKDRNNTSYYVDPASTTKLNIAHITGNVGIGTNVAEAKLDVVATGTEGTGVIAEATHPTGDTVGLEAIVFSPNGVAGSFVNEGGGRILMCHSGADPYDHAFSVDGNGDIWVEGRVFTRGTGGSSFAGDLWLGGNLLTAGTGNSSIAGNLGVFGSVDVNDNLFAQGDGYIGGNLNVGGVLMATLYALDTLGNGFIGGSLSIDDELSVGDNLSVANRLFVGSGVVVSGDLHVAGSLSKGSGSFKIDHPLDPGNKYLSHSFIESPDMMNVYNGNVVLDEKGRALIKLPEYFEALNVDFRYQLTCIGGFAPVYISEEISNNRFKIAGGKKGMKVSWQVTGIRQDRYAQAHRIAVEEDKPIEERGYYLHPAAYGLPEEKGIQAMNRPQFAEVGQTAGKAGEL